ncbi:MAG: hypothetical protein ACPGVI_04665 [Crocinitomicaceae bacterium]|jgi:F0F1-type ATP synthase membrane subunit b/b'
MEVIATLIILAQTFIFIGMAGLLIYFLVKRIKAKKTETFEDRDN